VSESNDAEASLSKASVRLKVTGIEVTAGHGVYPEERQLGNRFQVDVELDGDFERALASDELADTVDVDSIVETVRRISRQRTVHLIESLADAIVHALLEAFPQIAEALVRVRKLTLHRLEHVEEASVEVRRSRA